LLLQHLVHPPPRPPPQQIGVQEHQAMVVAKAEIRALAPLFSSSAISQGKKVLTFTKNQTPLYNNPPFTYTK
jgi:hypothetical protein